MDIYVCYFLGNGSSKLLVKGAILLKEGIQVTEHENRTFHVRICFCCIFQLKIKKRRYFWLLFTFLSIFAPNNYPLPKK